MPWARAANLDSRQNHRCCHKDRLGSFSARCCKFFPVCCCRRVLYSSRPASSGSPLTLSPLSLLPPLNNVSTHTQDIHKKRPKTKRYFQKDINERYTGAPAERDIRSSGGVWVNPENVCALPIFRAGSHLFGCGFHRGWYECTRKRDMPALPARRRSFFSLPTALEDDRPRGLKTHRSLASVIRRTAAVAGGGSSSGSLTTPAPEQQPQARAFTARLILGMAALALVSFAAGSWRSCTAGELCGEDSSSNGAAFPAGIDIHPNGHRNVSTSISAARTGPGLPPEDARERPFYDLVVAVLAVGGDSEQARDEIARVRKVYARYGSKVVPGGPTSTAAPLTFRVVFVVGRAGLPEDVELPGAGLLLEDFYHVDVREGYAHLSDKTKAMTGLADHLR